MAESTTTPSTGSQDKVCLGTTVSMDVNGFSRTVSLVENDQVDLKLGKIPPSAPLAGLIMGAKKGETVQGKIGEKDFEIKILEITTIDDEEN